MDSSPTMPSAESSAFSLLATGLQRQLYRMQWTQLHPVQIESIRAFFQSSRHLLIMAETAGGKTEAAFLPVLSQISQEPFGSVRAVYIGPLKALINDQFGRLEELCTHIEMPVHRWHGDVDRGSKKDVLDNPSGVLLITPESLESLLINRTRELPRVFGGLRAVVIDELHAFLENERGRHLRSLLTRLRRYLGPGQPEPRMLGLSATVGTPATAQAYLSPDAPENVTVIRPAGLHPELQFKVHGFPASTGAAVASNDDAGEEEDDQEYLRCMREIAKSVVGHCAGHSNLVFCNKKEDVELCADLANEECRSQGMRETFLVHHGALSKAIREDAEQRMKSGECLTAVCSSTLEMGIDIGSVHLVGQVGAPWSVSSLKQRLGRSGRRNNEPRRLRMYIKGEPTGSVEHPIELMPVDLLQSVALCELMP